MARAGAAILLNATISLREFVTSRFFREIYADGHNLPTWWRDVATTRGLPRDEKRNVVTMEP